MHAQSEPCYNVGSGNHPCRHSQPESMAGVVHVALRAPGLRAYRAGFRVDVNSFHRGEVNKQPVITASQSAVVTATTNGDKKLLIATKMHRADHIRCIDASSDKKGSLIHHSIIELADHIVSGIAF